MWPFKRKVGNDYGLFQIQHIQQLVYVPSIEIRYTTSTGRLLQITSEQAYFVCKYAGFGHPGTPDWYSILEFVNGDKLEFKPYLATPYDSDHDNEADQ